MPALAGAHLTQDRSSRITGGEVIWRRLPPGETPKQQCRLGTPGSSPKRDDEGLMSVQTPAEQIPQIALRPITLAWIVKRTALAVAILFVAISSMAWLTYASIDPHLEAISDENELPAADVTKVNLRF
jgi:hypothetical protein